MSIPVILLPVFAQIALTFALLVWMGRSRIGALRRGEAKIAQVALGQPNWPQKPLQIANCYANQFQLPMLFYVLTILAIVTRQADLLFVIMSWLFVAARFVHAFIHTGTNNVPRRFNAFLAGVAILLLMWAIFAARILMAAA